MRYYLLHQVVLVTVITFLVGATAANPDNISTSLRVDNDARRLRVDGDSTDTEDRNVFSSLASKAKKWANMKIWVHTEKSDDYVKQALGMNGLTKEQVMNHPNYKQLQKFWYKVEGRQLNTWLKDNHPTRWAWDQLRLTKEDEILNTDKFRTFVRYAMQYDDKMWIEKGGPFALPIYLDDTPIALSVKVDIWARFGRSNRYVKEMLGLKDVPNSALGSYTNFKYYENFLALKKAFKTSNDEFLE